MGKYDALNPQQYQAVCHYEGPLLILAGAGSGKTRVLTHRVAWLIEEKNVNPWNIMAITFTNKAAGEMRDRVEAMLGWWAIRRTMRGFPHSTPPVCGFCAGTLTGSVLKIILRFMTAKTRNP